MRAIFIGPLRFWAIWIVVLGVLWIAGDDQLHVRSYGWFLALLGGLTAASVLTILFTARKGERLTRDPIDDAEQAP